MSDLPHRQQLVRRMALICAALMLLTIGLSAFMRLWQAGLGCEPWPVCYAQAARDAAQGAVPPASSVGVAAARVTHRIVATLVLILVITMTMTAWLMKPAMRSEGRLAGALLVLALGLAVLGIVTPGSRIPAVALGNLLGGFLMFALCVRLATKSTTGKLGLERPALGVLMLLLAQIGLGAIISASHAALACGDLRGCWETAAAAGWSLQALNPWHVPALEATALVNPAGALAQGVHRALAPVVLLATCGLAWMAQQRDQRRTASWLYLLSFGVVAAGLVSVGAGLPMLTVLLHNALAAMLLAVVVRLV